MFTPPSATERAVAQQDADSASAKLRVHLAVRLTANDVQRAFRAALREVHPDAGGDAAAAPERLKELKAARDTLLAWLEQAPKADCTECGGTGWVFGRVAVRPCSRCGR